jgi:hypothetical protein
MAVGTIKEVWADIKAHPYVTAGIVFIGGAIIIYAYYSGGSTTPAASGANPYAAEQQAALSQEAIQAQAAAQNNAINSQAQSVANQVNGAVSIAGIASQTSLAAIGAGQTVDLAAIGAQTALGLGTIAAGTAADTNYYNYLGAQLASNERVAADQITTNSVDLQNIVGDLTGTQFLENQNLVQTQSKNANLAAGIISNATSPAAGGATNIYLPAGTVVQTAPATSPSVQ